MFIHRCLVFLGGTHTLRMDDHPEASASHLLVLVDVCAKVMQRRQRVRSSGGFSPQGCVSTFASRILRGGINRLGSETTVALLDAICL